MQLDDFDYHLPEELIAQEAFNDRSASRLMTVDRASGAIGDTAFASIGELLRADDLLVVNDTRVIPARLFGAKESGGRVEVFLVKRLAGDRERWECLIRASKPPRAGGTLFLAHGVSAVIEGRSADESWILEFSPSEGFAEWLERSGSIPLPPYIRRPANASDRERYQTIFALEKGAVAAPTAGLHFTPELLEELRNKGVTVLSLTLHVGLGTFQPVRVDDLRDHRMHRERYHLPEATAAAVNDRKRRGGRVVAVGTTVVRTLEHAAQADGTVAAGSGETDIFMYPGYDFRIVDAMLTNFHLPKSTLLMLVAAFAGRELVLRAYEEAVTRRYRFFSYGDAMFIS
jgi:S-adenosylmethionine:tRNA ribosyltransferase-isomerase